MSEKIKIDVTEYDIHVGTKNSYFSCPIAIALARATKTRIAVTTDKVYQFVPLQTAKIVAELPSVARKFVLAFDRGRPVEPFSFEMIIQG